jgi:hypothetical protein
VCLLFFSSCIRCVGKPLLCAIISICCHSCSSVLFVMGKLFSLWI